MEVEPHSKVVQPHPMEVEPHPVEPYPMVPYQTNVQILKTVENNKQTSKTAAIAIAVKKYPQLFTITQRVFFTPDSF